MTRKTKTAMNKPPIKVGSALSKIMANEERILTPRLAIHIMDHRDPEYRDDVVATIAEQLSAKPRVRTGTFGASSWGLVNCQRARVFRFLGYPDDHEGKITDRLASIYMDGHWRHLRWQAELLQAGLIDAIEVPVTGFGGWMRGTADAMMTGEYGVEIKGIHGRGFINVEHYGPKVEHTYQCQVYMALTGLTRWALLYECKATNEWREFVIHVDSRTRSVIADEISALSRAVMNRKLPPPIRKGSGRYESECVRCPWSQKCRTADSAVDWGPASMHSSAVTVHSEASAKIAPKRRP